MGAMKRLAEFTADALGLGSDINEISRGYAQHALDLAEKHLREPLTIDQMKHDGIDGIICITLNELITADIESFDDLLSMRLTGTDLLQDTLYSLCGIDVVNDLLYFRVEGDPSMILEQAE